MLKKHVIHFVILSGLALIAQADEYDIYREDKEVIEKKWTEETVTIPPFPQEKNLIELALPHSRVKYFIDKQSIQVGKQDQVARYTVIIQSPSGSRNIFFEGIRCDVKLYRTYAFAVNVNSFQPMNNSKWKLITGNGVYRYRLSLFDYVVCHESTVRYKPREIIQTLKHPPDLHAPELVD